MHKYYSYILLFLFALACISCDNRWVFKDANIPPELGLKLLNGQFIDENGNLVISLSDTLKLNTKTENETYTFDMKYFDENLVEINYEVTKGDGTLVQKNIAQPIEGQIDISEEEITLEYVPNELGEHEITFVATDIFGEKSASVTVFLFFFDNWEPVGDLQISFQGKTDPRHYLFDAGNSVDQDAAYGGGIVQYKYLINEYELLTTVPSINYIFQADGTFNVSLQVLDNDNVWSEVITEEVLVGE